MLTELRYQCEYVAFTVELELLRLMLIAMIAATARVRALGMPPRIRSANLQAKRGPLEPMQPISDDDHHEDGGDGDDHDDLQEVEEDGWYTCTFTLPALFCRLL